MIWERMDICQSRMCDAPVLQVMNCGCRLNFPGETMNMNESVPEALGQVEGDLAGAKDKVY